MYDLTRADRGDGGLSDCDLRSISSASAWTMPETLATTKEVATAAPEATKIRDNRGVFTPGREDDDTRVRTGYRTPKLALGNASRLQASLSIVLRQAEATAEDKWVSDEPTI